MKNIFTTITYVANQIKEAITGHKNDKQAHPDLNEQIKVLSEKMIKKNENNSTPKGLTIDSWCTVDGNNAGNSLLLSNLYHDDNGNYRYVNSHETGSGAGIRIGIFEKKPKYIYSTDSRCTKDEIANVKEVDLATTEKTEILLVPKSGFTILNQKNVKINNILYINTEIKKTDESMFTENQFVNALTIPFSVWNSTLSMIGAYNGFFQVSGSSIGYETHIAVVPTKQCSAIRITGEVVL